MLRALFQAAVAAATIAPCIALSQPPAASQGLTLDHAHELTLAHHPALRALTARRAAAEARRMDAGRRTNPELTLHAENLGVPDRGETSVQVSQPLELGGDRAARGELARALAAHADAEVRIEERLAFAATSGRFLDAWLLQERVGRLRHAVDVASEAIVAAAERFRQGAAPAVERLRAEAQHALRVADLARGIAESDVAREALALQWGGSPTVDSLRFTASLPDIPDLDRLLALDAAHPHRAALAATVAADAARVREALAARTPDLTLLAGVRRLEEAGRAGVEAGASVSLPVWNRGQGAVTAARAEHVASQETAAAAARHRAHAMRSAHTRLHVEVDALRTLNDTVIPKAREALALLRESYRAGRSGQLELIDAQRAVLEAEMEALAAFTNAWRERAELAGRSGTAMPNPGGAP